MEQGLISVIIPAYKCAGTIGKTLESVMYQGVFLEIWVINDCSPDDLDQVMKAYEQVPYLHYIKNEKNLGVSKTRNRGVSLANGEYIAFLDADDWWEKGKLKRQLELLQKTGDVLCCTGRELMTPEGRLTGKVIPVAEEIQYKKLLHHNSISCSSVLVKKEVMEEFPMDHDDSHEDYIAWLKILRKYKKACGISEPLLKYRLSNQGKSGNKLKSAGMTFQVYRYLGFGRLRAFYYFCWYAVHGVWKYSGLGNKK